MRCKIDENLPIELSELLQQAGYEAITGQKGHRFIYWHEKKMGKNKAVFFPPQVKENKKRGLEKNGT
ncbi:MAG: hypothetical protein AB1847_21920 [bacterium]